MAYEADAVAELAEATLASQHDDLQPGFYVVTGSHAYGFADDESDVDVRGMHLADGHRYMLLDAPRERVEVNCDGTTPGFEEWDAIELRSHELRALAEALTTAGFPAVEFVLVGEVVLDTVPEYTDALRDIVASALPLDVPAGYYGMARSVHDNHLVVDRSGDDPTPKHYLHAIRGLLAAEYVTEQGDLVADIRDLSTTVLGDDALVRDLIAAKRAGGELEADLQNRADDLLADLFETVDPPPERGTDRLRLRLDEWMLDLRREVTQPL